MMIMREMMMTKWFSICLDIGAKPISGLLTQTQPTLSGGTKGLAANCAYRQYTGTVQMSRVENKQKMLICF
jgi:hypothetical protein